MKMHKCCCVEVSNDNSHPDNQCSVMVEGTDNPYCDYCAGHANTVDKINDVTYVSRMQEVIDDDTPQATPSGASDLPRNL